MRENIIVKRSYAVLLAVSMFAALLPLPGMTASAAYSGPYYNDSEVRKRVWKGGLDLDEQAFQSHNIYGYFQKWTAWNFALQDRSTPLGQAAAAGQIEFRAAANVTTQEFKNTYQKPAIVVSRKDIFPVQRYKTNFFYDTNTWFEAKHDLQFEWTDAGPMSGGGQGVDETYLEKWFNSRYVIMQDKKQPTVSSVKYVEGGETYVPGKGRKNRLTGGRVTVDITFNEPIAPESAGNLKLMMGGMDVDNLIYRGAQKLDISTINPNSYEPQTGLFDVYKTFRYTFDLPDGIQTDLTDNTKAGGFTFYHNSGTPVVDYFGGNELSDTQVPVYWECPFEVDTIAPELKTVVTEPESFERYYTAASDNMMAKTVYVGMEFTKELYLPDGTTLKGGIYENKNGSGKGELLKEITFVQNPYKSGGEWFSYTIRPDDPEGVIDLLTSDSWTDGNTEYYDLKNIFNAPDGSALDITTIAGEGGTKMRTDGMQTRYNTSGEEPGAAGTVLYGQYMRQKLPELSIYTDSDDYASEHTVYVMSDKTGVYYNTVTLADILSDDPAVRDEGAGKAYVEFQNIDVTAADLNGNPLNDYGGAAAVNVLPNENPAGGLKVKAREGYQIERTVGVTVKATDISGAKLTADAGQVKLDNKPPRISAELGKGIDDSENPGVSEAAVFYKLFAEDISMEGGSVKYRYISGDDPQWLDAEYISEGGYYNAPLAVPANTSFTGVLEVMASDRAGNISEVKAVEVSFQNLVPFDAGQVMIETDGWQQEHTVTINPNILSSYDTVEYMYYRADTSAKYVKSEFRAYDGSYTIGSHEDQRLCMMSDEYFNGSYILLIRAASAMGSISASFRLDFLNDAPAVKIDNKNCNVPGDTIGVTVDTPLADSMEYEIRRPDGGAVYDSGAILSREDFISLPASLNSGYYELVVKAHNIAGKAVQASRFIYIDESKLDVQLSASVTDWKTGVEANKDGVTYRIFPYDTAVEGKAECSFNFENGGLLNWEDEVYISSAEGGIILGPVAVSEEAGRVICSVTEIQASGNGSRLGLQLLWRGGPIIDTPLADMYQGVQVIDKYAEKLAVTVENRGVQEDGAMLYEFAAADPLGLARVDKITAENAEYYRARSYSYRNTDGVTGPPYSEVNLFYDYYINDPGNYYTTIKDGDRYTGIKFMQGAKVELTLVPSAEGIEGKSQTIQIIEQDMPAIYNSSDMSLRADYDYSDANWKKNVSGLSNDKYYPVASNRQFVRDSYNDPATNNKNGAGYMRPAIRFYSDVYPISRIALVATNDTEGRYGQPNFDIFEYQPTDADAERFESYQQSGKLTSIISPHTVTYKNSGDGAPQFTETHDSYTVTLLDNTEYRTYLLYAELDLGNGRTKWEYVSDTLWPNHYMNDHNIYTTNYATAGEIPKFDFSDQAGADSDTAYGTLELAYPCVTLSADQMAEITGIADIAGYDKFDIEYSLPETAKQALRAYALSLPMDSFQNEVRASFTPGGEYQFFLVNLTGQRASMAKYSESDYDVPYGSSTTSVMYYSDYKNNMTWNGDSWISLYSDNEAKIPADIAIDISPNEDENEYYYIEASDGMHALIDPLSVILDKSETGGNTELDAVIDSGKVLYKNLLLRPDVSNPDDPFGTFTIMAVNVSGEETKSYSVPVKYNVQGTAPEIAIEENITGEERYITVRASDTKSGVRTLEVSVNGIAQSVTGDTFYGGPYAKTEETVVSARAVNNAGLIAEESKTYAPGIDPSGKPALGVDYNVGYWYKGADGQFKALEEGKKYAVVYAVIELLNDGTAVKNNGGNTAYAFLPGSDTVFEFELENSSGITVQAVINPRPVLPSEIADIGYKLSADSASAEITISTAGADLSEKDISLTFAENPVSLTAHADGSYTAVVKENGIYQYRITKDGYTVKTGSVDISGITAQEPLSADVFYSKSEQTYNNVIVRFTTNKPAEVLGVAGSPSVIKLSDTQYVFSENGDITVTFSNGAEQVSKTAVVENIDKTPPDAGFNVEYRQVNNENVSASISFTAGAEPLELFTLSGIRKLDGGFIGTGALTGKRLNEVEMAVYKNGIYRLAAADAAGNIQNIDVTIDKIDDTLPEITNVKWNYASGGSGEKEVSGGYIEILEKDGNTLTNQDLTVTVTANKEVAETGSGSAEYKKEFVKVFPVNARANYVFEDRLGNAADLNLKVGVIDKEMPVIEFDNGSSLYYYALNKEAYSKDDLYQFKVGDYKDGVYIPMDKNTVSIDFGEFDPDNISANVFDYKKPYIITYTISDSAGNKTVTERIVRLFGPNDICVLVNGSLPDGDIAEVDSSPFEVRVENYSGNLFASISPGEYNSSQMKNKGELLALKPDKKSFEAQVASKQWYTVSVRTETMESFTFNVWVN